MMLARLAEPDRIADNRRVVVRWFQFATCIALMACSACTVDAPAPPPTADTPGVLDASVAAADAAARPTMGPKWVEAIRPAGRAFSGATPLDASTPVADAGTAAPDAGPAVRCPEVPGTFFQDVTACASIAATHTGRLEHTATGQAWGDYDGDGWIDLYVTDNAGPNTLYRNDGDGGFSRSPLASLVEVPMRSSGGAVFVDYDNDGDKDLYVLNLGPNMLFRNEGGRSFIDVTASAGVGDVGKGQTASFGDYDNDGFVDLYVANWICTECSQPEGVEGARDRLYHNEGDGTFTDVTHLLGMDMTVGAGFVAVWMDFDNDGDSDIYLANDKGHPGDQEVGHYMNRNLLWRNDGAGCRGWCFTEVGRDVGADARVDGMGLAVGDYDNDGDLDMYCSNTGRPVLLRNRGNGTFEDVGALAGVDYDSVSWGAVFFDFDNDTFLDAYLAVGLERWGITENRLYHNRGDGTFADLTDEHVLPFAGEGLGVAYADYDKDGAVDLIVGNWNSGYALYRNTMDIGASNHWLRVRLSGAGPVNRDAIGAKVTIETTDGRTLMQQVKCGSSHGAGNDLALHFGLGTATPARMTIRWPDGMTETTPNVPYDREIRRLYPE